MDALTLTVALVLGGGGIVGAAYNWWTLRRQSRNRIEDFFWQTYVFQAESAEKRGDSAEGIRIRLEYEHELEAYRDQHALRRLLPPERLHRDE